jgi:uncharacterized protein with HEPN domain
MQPHLRNDLLYCLRMLEAVEKVQLYAAAYTDPLFFFTAEEGRDFDASLMMMAQIGEQAGRCSGELKMKHTGVDWQQLKSFRNRAVHDYTGLDRFLIFEIIKKEVPALKTAVSEIVRDELESGGFDREEYEVAKTSPYLRHVDFAFIEN